MAPRNPEQEKEILEVRWYLIIFNVNSYSPVDWSSYGGTFTRGRLCRSSSEWSCFMQAHQQAGPGKCQEVQGEGGVENKLYGLLFLNMFIINHIYVWSHNTTCGSKNEMISIPKSNIFKKFWYSQCWNRNIKNQSTLKHKILQSRSL